MKKSRPVQPSPQRRPLVLWGTGLIATALIVGYVALGERAGVSAPQPDAPLRPAPARPAASTYSVVATHPHDPSAFTQGLVYRDGFLFESTGLNGFSSLRKVRLETGEVVQSIRLESRHFAEGLTDWQDQLVQITWQSNVGFVYDAATFALRRSFRYDGEGWGLAQDGRRIIMSDGTSTLRFLDPSTLLEIGRVTVTENGRPLAQINELEMVRGELFANVWQTDDVIVIRPETGGVIERIDFSGLRARLAPGERIDVLNGIAYDAAGDRLFLTGKLWPSLFEVRLARSR